jgi:carbon-monoxide dehydrogenase medium subunit
MPACDYVRPATLAEALALLADPDAGEAAALAGGHTLLPAMKAGLRAPDRLVDLAAIPELTGVSDEGARVRVGAMTRHAALARDAIVAARLPSLAAAARMVGDPAVRARGTLGGALANNDPAADYPAALLALDGEVETNRRRIAADDFIQGMFATALEEGELIVAVRFRPPLAADYAKFRHPISRYAMAGVHVARHAEGVRVGVTGLGQGAFRWHAAEAALAADFSPAAVAGLRPDPALATGDIHASAEYRCHLAGLMLARAVAEAMR